MQPRLLPGPDPGAEDEREGSGRGWLEAGRVTDAREPRCSEQTPGEPPANVGLVVADVSGARAELIRLQPLRGQPLLHMRWGWLAGWIRDVALDPRAGRVTAFEVELAVQPRRAWMAPFPLWRSQRTREALEADPDQWQFVERACDWIGLDALGGLLMVEADGDRTERVVDAEVDPETWAIQAYLLRRPWWQRLRRPRLARDQVLRCGQDLLIVQSRRAGPGR